MTLPILSISKVSYGHHQIFLGLGSQNFEFERILFCYAMWMEHVTEGE